MSSEIESKDSGASGGGSGGIYGDGSVIRFITMWVFIAVVIEFQCVCYYSCSKEQDGENEREATTESGGYADGVTAEYSEKFERNFGGSDGGCGDGCE